MEVSCDRRYSVPVGPAELWTRLAQVDRYRSWWPWLRSFDGRLLRCGEVWHCTVRPPAPYSVRFSVTIDQVVAERSVAATVAGDVVGSARFEVVATSQGSEIHLTSTLHADKPLLRLIGSAARPVARFAHNWVLDTGARQFAERACAV